MYVFVVTSFIHCFFYLLLRCKSNYASLQWDEGSSVLFQPAAVFEKLTRKMAESAGAPQPGNSDIPGVTELVKECLLETADNGQAPDACLLIYLTERNKKKEDYFVYETFVPDARQESWITDACEVHTGPAASLPVPNDFEKCLTNDKTSQCNIPLFIWSGRSTGKTPVADYHSWTESSSVAQNIDLRSQKAFQTFISISKEMAAIIKAVNDSFVDSPISAELFSAEGDALHQLMDCMFMGPFARMDYYGTRNRGSGMGDLPVPSWSRMDAWSEGGDGEDGLSASRAFPIPCSTERVHGDYGVPFTCGSEPRRAVIKYFVRNYAGPVGSLPGQCGTDDVNRTVQDATKKMLMNVVHSRLTALHSVWSDYSRFSCEQVDSITGLGTGVHGVQYCSTKDSDTWVPKHIRDWDHATSAQVMLLSSCVKLCWLMLLSCMQTFLYFLQTTATIKRQHERSYIQLCNFS